MKPDIDRIKPERNETRMPDVEDVTASNGEEYSMFFLEGVPNLILQWKEPMNIFKNGAHTEIDRMIELEKELSPILDE
jgi:hypothetical protein